MKYSGIGGQAVMEGVMMRSGNRYAVAVRKSDGEIVVSTKDVKGIFATDSWKKIPFVRGVLALIESLVTGISTLMYSASFFEEDEEEEKQKKEALKSMSAEEKKKFEAKEKKKENAFMGGTLFLSLVLAVAIFMILPYWLSTLFSNIGLGESAIAVIEGALRLVIFIVYIVLISRMNDIQRTFMYHGAEHKCINCIEHGLDLSVENVRKSSREHKRCGTSFLVFVIILSIILFLFIRVDSHVLRIVIRLALVPVIAGISYEILRAAGKYDNFILNLISKPGMLVQRLTTREPDDSMIEVGIASVEAVFDWREYVLEYRREEGTVE